jgi:hypothetical protein
MLLNSMLPQYGLALDNNHNGMCISISSGTEGMPLLCSHLTCRRPTRGVWTTAAAAAAGAWAQVPHGAATRSSASSNSTEVVDTFMCLVWWDPGMVAVLYAAMCTTASTAAGGDGPVSLPVGQGLPYPGAAELESAEELVGSTTDTGRGTRS